RLRRKMADEGDGAVTPLKLIVMSATLKAEDFAHNPRLFQPPPPLLRVPARQFPVTVHFARRTPAEDYVGAAVRKAAAVHRRLPPGGVLIFLTGQAEVRRAVDELRAMFPGEKSGKTTGRKEDQKEDREEDREEEGEPRGEEAAQTWAGGADDAEADGRLEGLLLSQAPHGEDDYERGERQAAEDEEEDETAVLGGDGVTPEEVAAAEKAFEDRLITDWLRSLEGDERGAGKAAGAEDVSIGGGAAAADESIAASSTTLAEDALRGPPITCAAPAPSVRVLPLYAMLPSEAQSRVFAPVPPGTRLIVVATNVAETSLTIPGIRYVVDAGREKRRVEEAGAAGVARFDVGWISAASAEQRAGRAGRTGPGHCYRLF
ncbi:hypothetical protein H632_c3728p0, partial [Helicosporidium sp. ATCC 50920]